MNIERIAGALSTDSKKTLIVAKRLSNDNYIVPRHLADATGIVDKGFGAILKTHNYKPYEYSGAIWEDVLDLKRSVSGASKEAKEAMHHLTDDTKTVLELAELYSLMNTGNEQIQIEPMHILLAALDFNAGGLKLDIQNPKVAIDLRIALLAAFQDRLKTESVKSAQPAA